MKYVLVLLVVLVALYMWRSARRVGRDEPRPDSETHRQQQPVQDMITCGECGVHVPQTEAIQGTRGLYCSTAHRQSREG